MCRATTQTITVTCPAPLSLKTLCPDPHAQHGSGPRQTNRRMGIAGTFFIVTLTDMLRKSVPGSRGRTPAYRQSHQKRSQKVKTKRQPAPSTRLTKRTKDEETRSVPPRGSVIQQNMTKLASIATRSTATQTTNSVTDGSSLQQSRSIQGKYWLDLQRLQHSIQQIFQRTREPSRKLPARSPTAVLEQLRDRIRSISLDMNAHDKSCSVETEIQQPSKEPRITASCCTWFRSTVDNSSFMKALPSCAISTVPPVFFVTQSGRGDVTDAATAKGYSTPRSRCWWYLPGPLTTWTPGCSARGLAHRTPNFFTARSQCHLLDDSPLPNCPIRDIVVTERDKQPLADLRRVSAMAIPRCIVSRNAPAWAESLEGAISGHQSRAALCRHRCRLLLAEVPKGCDRNVETSAAVLGDWRDQ